MLFHIRKIDSVSGFRPALTASQIPSNPALPDLECVGRAIELLGPTTNGPGRAVEKRGPFHPLQPITCRRGSAGERGACAARADDR